ncbi:MAG: type IV pilus assembly protein PilM, partial [Patescibacteria group bacterium]
MELFARPDRFLGVDIGSHNLKVVELENNHGRAKLITYGYSDQVVPPTDPELADQPEVAAVALKQLLKKTKTTSHRVVAALPVATIFTSVLVIAKDRFKNDQELKETIQWEAKKVIPLTLDEMILEHSALDNDAEEGSARFLLTAAPKALVQKYLEIFKHAGLQLASLETENFALVRSLVGNDKATVMVVDLGEITTNIAIIRQGIPVLNKSVDVAGKQFTEVFAKQLGVEWPVAERFKRDLMTTGLTTSLTALEPLLQNLRHEIQYCFGLHRQEHPAGNEQVEKIILTGGTAALAGMDQYLASQLQLKVFVGDPWARVMYPEELKPALDAIGSRLAISVGLAMREI